jgi:hypothetical protein
MNGNQKDESASKKVGDVLAFIAVLWPFACVAWGFSVPLKGPMPLPIALLLAGTPFFLPGLGWLLVRNKERLRVLEPLLSRRFRNAMTAFWVAVFALYLVLLISKPLWKTSHG